MVFSSFEIFGNGGTISHNGLVLPEAHFHDGSLHFYFSDFQMLIGSPKLTSYILFGSYLLGVHLHPFERDLT